jgi:ABC-type sugar transport system ATPase subunit
VTLEAMSPPPADVLDMSQITKDFPGVRALSDVSLRVKRGHVHALVGENGAGKSTLMKILDGVYPSGTYRGTIRLDGVPVELHSPHDAKRKGIGYVPQEITVIEALTVAENVFVGNLTEGRGVVVRFRDLYVRAGQFLRERNIDLDPRKPVSSLPASRRQLVMIARALATRPWILILDEPTSSLTLGETNALFRIVRHLQREGVTTLLITHKLAEIFELADRVTVLRDGAVVANFDRGAFTEADVVTAMVGRKIENFYPTRTVPIGTGEVLRVEGLTVPHPHIARKNVVDGVGFSLRRGEILGLAGLVGAGRSEVVNALYGRLPHGGRVFVGGREVRIRSPRDAKANGIGLLTEERKQDGLLFNFAIRENITIGSLGAVSRLRVLSRRRENRCAQEYMRRLAIRAPSVKTMVANLSGGNQQKVVLAKVLLPNPRVLLLDEPTKGVDVGAKYEIYKLMMELVAQGISLVVISSELPELLALCDRLVVLAGGKVTGRFMKDEATEERVMLAATGKDSGAEVRPAPP